MGRPDRLAVLPIGDEGLTHDLVGEWDAAFDAGAVAAFGQHPGRSAILADEIDEEAERNSRPFIGAHQPVSVLHGQGVVGLLPVFPSIASALDEMDPRDRRHGDQVVDRQNQRLLHQAVDQQTVFGRVEIGHARVAALVRKREAHSCLPSMALRG